MKIFLHAELDAPSFPTHLYDHKQEWKKLQPVLDKFDISQDATQLAREVGYKLVNDQEYDKSYRKQKNRQVTLPNNEITKSAHSHWNLLDDRAILWIEQNITKHKITDARHCFTTPGRKVIGAHRDLTRNFVLMYLLSTGGDNHATVFYREKGHDDIDREYGYHVDDHNQLEEISRIQIKLNTWTLISASVLHGVENIPDIRRSFMIGFRDVLSDVRYKNAVYWDTDAQQTMVEHAD